MLGLIVYLVVVGIVAGYLARLLVPGRDPMSFVQTMVLGIVGSFVGGFLGYVLFDKDFGEGALQASGLTRIHHRRHRRPPSLPGRGHRAGSGPPWSPPRLTPLPSPRPPG